MRFAYISLPYPAYVRHAYATDKEREQRPFAEQHERVMADSFHWIGAWERSFGRLGHEVLGIYADIKPLQLAWWSEHGGGGVPVDWETEIAIHQLRRFAPDVLLLDNGRKFTERWIKRLRQLCPNLRMVIGYAGSPSYDLATLKACDMVLSCSRRLVREFSDAGCYSRYFKHGFNTQLLEVLPRREPSIDSIFFAGGVARAKGFHLERERLLIQLAKSVPLTFHCPQCEISPLQDWAETMARRVAYAGIQLARGLRVEEQFCELIPRIRRARNWRGMPMRQINSELRQHMRRPIFAREMFSQMRRHAVALNMHIDMAGEEAGNIRLFEATGVGACLLTDWKPALAEFFEADREVVTYQSGEECLEKAKWLLAKPKEREAIALAGQRRTVREHSYDQRALELDGIIAEKLKSIGALRDPASPVRSGL